MLKFDKFIKVLKCDLSWIFFTSFIILGLEKPPNFRFVQFSKQRKENYTIPFTANWKFPSSSLTRTYFNKLTHNASIKVELIFIVRNFDSIFKLAHTAISGKQIFFEKKKNSIQWLIICFKFPKYTISHYNEFTSCIIIPISN